MKRLAALKVAVAVMTRTYKRARAHNGELEISSTYKLPGARSIHHICVDRFYQETTGKKP